jgi:hypothetical protein
MARPVLVCALLLLASGCAFTQADLAVQMDAASARRGPLTEAPPTAFAYAPLVDSRIDRARIGHKKNGYGQNTADIQALKPVIDIVQEAVRLTLEANGHPTSAPEAVRVEGEVSQFWFETQVNFWTIEFMATVESKLRFVDAATGSVLHEGKYIGHYNEKSAGGYEKSWERVLNLALRRMAEAIAMDDDLAEALRARIVRSGPSWPVARNGAGTPGNPGRLAS